MPKYLIRILFIVVWSFPYACVKKSSEKFAEMSFDANGYGMEFPNSKFTPGDSVPGITMEKVCAPGYSGRIRDTLTSKQKRRVYKLYGVKPDTAKYKIDHLIPLSIGGSNDIKNLWPQPILENVGFKEKQIAAQYLHESVCDGSIPLKEAQKRIAQNWHSVYLEAKSKKSEKENVSTPLFPQE